MISIANANQSSLRDTRKSQLMDIAVERFARYGYQNTKISDIVNDAGVAQGTFYWYFKSKEAIALEIIEAGREDLLAVIKRGYRTGGGSVQEMVQGSQRLLADIFRFAQEHRYFMQLLLMDNGEEEAIRNAFRETRIEMEDSFRRNIERAVELGMLPKSSDIHIRAALLMSLIEGIVARWLFGPNPSDSNLPELAVDELAAQAVHFEFFGLLGI
ncbi:TetR family transcriptional regulator [Paenibacillus sp. J22TS3]|nr:TetR family transcriptional regulator [Paenibacillus sp. J22TS3]